MSAKLQKVYPDFGIKATIVSTDPIQADIGLKEGITIDDEYEVLEKEIDQNGIISLKRVGIIKPAEGKICDNRYMASYDNESSSELKYTTFEKMSGKDIYPGMLIREIR